MQVWRIVWLRGRDSIQRIIFLPNEIPKDVQSTRPGVLICHVVGSPNDDLRCEVDQGNSCSQTPIQDVPGMPPEDVQSMPRHVHLFTSTVKDLSETPIPAFRLQGLSGNLHRIPKTNAAAVCILMRHS
eukprot:CAMPEP_0170199692 /NCGR_PEP_ID=MMETSP0040_2-20121228/69474_1 /TAXON_ID=641309 /ORGANISM="Lotharella oceanica, Strain CCMP622" /LENGTH=127 /DNA_ID=CAMNT_0010449833 /DNA_START=635 /DNA_END=1018 /DNA_ORIENTATION=+